MATEGLSEELLAKIADQARQGLIEWRLSKLSYLEADWNGGKLFVGRNRLQDDITFEVKMTLTVELAQVIKASMKG